MTFTKNRWHVYEFLKQTYMFSGRLPTWEAIMLRFRKETTMEEITEGINEFMSTVQVQVPRINDKAVEGA